VIGYTHTHVCILSITVYGLIFTKLSGSTDQVVEDATVRSRDVAMVTDLWRVSTKMDTPHLYSVRWHSTTYGKIAKRVRNVYAW